MGKSKSLKARSSVGIAVQLFACLVGSLSCSEHTRALRNGSPHVKPGESSSGGQLGEGGASSATALSSGTHPAAVAEGSAGEMALMAGDAGASSATRDGGGGVVLTAVVMSVSPNGALGIAAEWANHTDEPIFLQGCSTVEGWFLKDGQWERYGAFALCAAETRAVEVSPGETYLDISGAAGSPPKRGTNVWRLVGRYGVGCQRGALLGASQCREIRELTSVNQIAWAP